MEINIFLFSQVLSFAEDLHLQKFYKLISIMVMLSCLANGDVTVLRFELNKMQIHNMTIELHTFCA